MLNSNHSSEKQDQTILLLRHKLLMYAAMMYQMLPEKKTVTLIEIGRNLLQKQFFQMLPTEFTKQDAIAQAEVLGVGNKTIDRWLRKYINPDDIQHIAHGRYSKNTTITAETVPVFSENCYRLGIFAEDSPLLTGL